MLEAVCGALGVFVVGAVELGALALLIELGLETVRADDECVGVCSLVLGEEEVVVEVGRDEIPSGKQVSQQQNGTTQYYGRKKRDDSVVQLLPGRTSLQAGAEVGL